MPALHRDPIPPFVEQMQVLGRKGHRNRWAGRQGGAVEREYLERQAVQDEMQDDTEAGWLDKFDIGLDTGGIGRHDDMFGADAEGDFRTVGQRYR